MFHDDHFDHLQNQIIDWIIFVIDKRLCCKNLGDTPHPEELSEWKRKFTSQSIINYEDYPVNVSDSEDGHDDHHGFWDEEDKEEEESDEIEE